MNRCAHQFGYPTRVKKGDLAEVIGGALNMANLGKIVEVTALLGTHSRYGVIWRCRAAPGGSLVTEYGAVGIAADFADDWLRPIPKEPLPAVNDALYIDTPSVDQVAA